MKKVVLFSLLFIYITIPSVHALNWAITFVSWDGKMYEIKHDEVIEENEIGKIIGKVKRIPDFVTGEFYGNASNYYPIGTSYYEIIGIPTSEAIAVEENDRWIKAVYVHEAPFHIMNILTNPIVIIAMIIVTLTFIGVIFKIVKSVTQNKT